MTVLFWDRKNQPIHNTIEWARMFEDAEHRIVALDYDEERSCMVSTIWQGIDLDHNPYVTDETAMIFESAVIIEGELEEKFFYHSEASALEGHKRLCQQHLERDPRPEDRHRETVIEREKKHG